MRVSFGKYCRVDANAFVARKRPRKQIILTIESRSAPNKDGLASKAKKICASSSTPNLDRTSIPTITLGFGTKMKWNRCVTLRDLLKGYIFIHNFKGLNSSAVLFRCYLGRSEGSFGRRSERYPRVRVVQFNEYSKSLKEIAFGCFARVCP